MQTAVTSRSFAGVGPYMRLAFIKKRFSVHGGAEKYLQTLMRQLSKEGYEIHIFAHQWSEREGATFHKVGILPFGSFLSVVTFNMNARSALEKGHGMDCVVSFERTTCQDIYRAGEGCHREWLTIRSRVVPLYKRLSFRINPLHLSILAIEKRLFSDTGLIVANSKMVKQQIMRHYAVPEERITIIYNGVDLVRFSPDNREVWRDKVRQDLSLSADDTLLLFVGSGFIRKGLKTLISAMSLVKEHNLKALVIGGDKVNGYRRWAAQCGMNGKIFFLGPQREIEQFYAGADLFVLPTLYDPFSNATLEAMASGLPVITTSNNGAAELIENGKEGFVIPDPLDVRELADTLRDAISHIPVMAERAREKAEQYPIQKAAQEFIETIRRVKETDRRLDQHF
ncbi:MAG TPA: glycosyltransferase family 4 protein [Thermodesulfovibrionales bacterium]|nr:glycosyltransferase family 4 protein [Thermodesulfovibrionales bacterium]